MHFRTIGDTAICITLGPGDPRPQDFAEALRGVSVPGLVDAFAAFDTVSIVYEPAELTTDDPIAWWTEYARRTAASLTSGAMPETATLIELPVAYGGEDGPDLVALAWSLALSTHDLIDRHAAATYTVTAVGFVPGFAYLDGLPTGLHAARRSTPRVRVPAGSVAIGGPYTGVYPVDSPGGWHLIGRTPRRLFDPADPSATPWRVGDRVKFVPQPGLRT